MTTLYIDCGMGAAGDMLAAALAELTPDPAAAVAELNAMGVPGVSFVRRVETKCGITGARMVVTVHGAEEDDHPHAREHEHSHEETHDHHSEHSHEHHHHEHRGMADIARIVDGLDVPPEVKGDVMAVYREIAEAESAVHGRPVDQVHFHEVGALDAVADIAAVSLLVHRLAPGEIVASPVNTGSGSVRCAHGILPVPAPATALLLRGVPAYSDGTDGELCTPTGAALLKHFAARFAPMPPIAARAVGYGLGRRDFPRANVLRAIFGDSAASGALSDEVALLSCEIDDMTGEEIAFACERLFAAGALDVVTAAVGMKKGRQGVSIRVTCRTEDGERLADEIFRLTTTLGVRTQTCRRRILARREETAPDGRGGTVRRKIASGAGVAREKIEYDDAARIAAADGVDLRAARRALRG